MTTHFNHSSKDKEYKNAYLSMLLENQEAEEDVLEPVEDEENVEVEEEDNKLEVEIEDVEEFSANATKEEAEEILRVAQEIVAAAEARLATFEDDEEVEDTEEVEEEE